MVTVNVDIAALKARHPLGDTVEALGVRLVVEGAGSARASAPSTTRRKAASRCTATRKGSTASGVAQGATCWTSSGASSA